MIDAETPKERTVWVAHPSRMPFIPGIVLPIVLSLLLNHQMQLGAKWIVERTYPTVPWTDATAALFIGVAPWLLCIWSVVSLLRMLLVRFTRYELTTQRLKVDEGVLSRTHDEVALHRIRDYNVARPLSGLLFGVGTIRLITRDPTHPVLDLRMVSDAYERTELIRRNAIEWKAVNGYREFEGGSLSDM